MLVAIGIVGCGEIVLTIDSIGIEQICILQHQLPIELERLRDIYPNNIA